MSDLRPALLLPAALLLVPLSFLFFALVTLPLLIPAFLLLRTYARTAVKGTGLWTAATTAVILPLLVAALVTFFAHEDPREYFGESTSFYTSDIVTYAEAALSLVLTAVALAVGWRFASSPIRSLPHQKIEIVSEYQDNCAMSV